MKKKDEEKKYCAPWCAVLGMEQSNFFCASIEKPSFEEEDWKEEEEKDGDEFEIEL